MWEYSIPVIIFLVVYGLVYKMYEKEENINVNAAIPSIILSIIVFCFMKYRNEAYEPVMQGNYFE
jgi:hypothetical protein